MTRESKLRAKRAELRSVVNSIGYLRSKRLRVAKELHDEIRRAELLQREIKLLEEMGHGKTDRLAG